MLGEILATYSLLRLPTPGWSSKYAIIWSCKTQILNILNRMLVGTSLLFKTYLCILRIAPHPSLLIGDCWLKPLLTEPRPDSGMHVSMINRGKPEWVADHKIFGELSDYGCTSFSNKDVPLKIVSWKSLVYLSICSRKCPYKPHQNFINYSSAAKRLADTPGIPLGILFRSWVSVCMELFFLILFQEVITEWSSHHGEDLLCRG